MADETIAEHRTYGDQPMCVRGGMLAKNITVKQCIEFNSTHSSSTSAIKVVSGTTTVSRLISATVSPATVDEYIYLDVTYATGTDCMYIKTTCVATSGTLQAGRFRAEGRAAGASTANIHGVHAQGIAKDALYSGTVNALYAEAIAKATSTVTTLRGAMICADSEGTPTAIGTMYACHIRLKTSKDPTTANAVLVVESEKFGAGITTDAMVLIKDTTWQAANTTADVGIEFAMTGKCTSLIGSNAQCTYLLNLDSATGKGMTAASLKQSEGTDIKCDGYLTIRVATTSYYIALYNSTA